MLGLPKSEWIILVGMMINGSGNIFSFIPNTPEVINLLTEKYKIVEGIDDDLVAQMNDSVASLYQISFNLGGLCAPIIGASIYQGVGYGTTMLIISCFILLMCLSQLFINAGFRVFANFREQKETLNHLVKMKEILKEYDEKNENFDDDKNSS